MFKEGGHRLFEKDPETARVVAEMLADLEAHGLEAVRRFTAAAESTSWPGRPRSW